MMTPIQFHELDHDEQEVIIDSSEYISKKIVCCSIVKLYSFQNFFIEIWENLNSDLNPEENDMILAFSASSDAMNMWIKHIELPV